MYIAKKNVFQVSNNLLLTAHFIVIIYLLSIFFFLWVSKSQTVSKETAVDILFHLYSSSNDVVNQQAGKTHKTTTAIPNCISNCDVKQKDNARGAPTTGDCLLFAPWSPLIQSTLDLIAHMSTVWIFDLNICSNFVCIRFCSVYIV